MTRTEIIEALEAGKKLRNIGWDEGVYVVLDKEYLKNKHGLAVGHQHWGALLDSPESVKIYEESPEIKKVTYYRRKWRMFPGGGDLISNLSWHTSKKEFDQINNVWVASGAIFSDEWEEMTIEVPEETK